MLNAILGNASSVDVTAVKEKYKNIFIEGEEVEMSFKLIRDTLIFTSNRLIMIDVQGLTGSKKDFHSIPYRSIYHFSIESNGTFDMDSELKFWLAGSNSAPVVKKLSKGVDITAIGRLLAFHVCK